MKVLEAAAKKRHQRVRVSTEKVESNIDEEQNEELAEALTELQATYHKKQKEHLEKLYKKHRDLASSTPPPLQI